MATTTQGLIRAGTLEEVRARGCSVVTGGGHTIAVFHHDGQVPQCSAGKPIEAVRGVKNGPGAPAGSCRAP